MKKHFKIALASILLIAATAFAPLMFENRGNTSGMAFTVYAENEKGEDNFNFIKSKEDIKDFLYDGTWLLYGGIALIAVSVMGIVLTFIPKKRKKRRRSPKRR